MSFSTVGRQRSHTNVAYGLKLLWLVVLIFCRYLETSIWACIATMASRVVMFVAAEVAHLWPIRYSSKLITNLRESLRGSHRWHTPRVALGSVGRGANSHRARSTKKRAVRCTPTSRTRRRPDALRQVRHRPRLSTVPLVWIPHCRHKDADDRATALCT